MSKFAPGSVVDKTFTSADIIKRFTSRAYFDGRIVAHETDWLYKPDIAIVSRDLMVSEYEIKVSLQDLRGRKH